MREMTKSPWGTPRAVRAALPPKPENVPLWETLPKRVSRSYRRSRIRNVTNSPWGMPRAVRHQQPDADPTSKYCPRCTTLKPVSAFARLKNGKLEGYCRECNRARNVEYRRTHPHAPGSRRGSHFLRTYGISIEQYDAMLDEQGGVCAICGMPETRTGRNGIVLPLAVDHDHETGIVRGLLCSTCNTGIGGLMHDVELLQLAIAYLMATQESSLPSLHDSET
jgi:hypothetical protein